MFIVPVKNGVEASEGEEFVLADARLPHRIPERPGFYYRGRGWKGYADFLGLEEGSDDGDEPRTDE